MADEQPRIPSDSIDVQGDIREILASIESKQKQIEALCTANQQELGKLKEAYQAKLSADQDEYRKSQEAYRSSQAAWKKNEEGFKWARLPCFITTLIITALVAYIAWRVS